MNNMYTCIVFWTMLAPEQAWFRKSDLLSGSVDWAPNCNSSSSLSQPTLAQQHGFIIKLRMRAAPARMTTIPKLARTSHNTLIHAELNVCAVDCPGHPRQDGNIYSSPQRPILADYRWD